MEAAFVVPIEVDAVAAVPAPAQQGDNFSHPCDPVLDSSDETRGLSEQLRNTKLTDEGA
jgi:hypothetical protein